MEAKKAKPSIVWVQPVPSSISPLAGRCKSGHEFEHNGWDPRTLGQPSGQLDKTTTYNSNYTEG